MAKTKLHYFPGTCAQVTAVALERIGEPFDLALVDFRSAEARAAYAAGVNPKGKVPALEIDGETLTENAAILWHLHHRFPDAQLLPLVGDAVAATRQLADLIWCSSTLHPMVRQVRMPRLWTTGDTAGVVADGTAKLQQQAQIVVSRVGGDGWWYGSAWSIVDAYLWWCFRNAERGGFDLSGTPAVLDYLARVEQQPPVAATIAREADLGLPPMRRLD